MWRQHLARLVRCHAAHGRVGSALPKYCNLLRIVARTGEPKVRASMSSVAVA